ncbi:MAG: Nif11 family protein [Cyanobacteriota bacterium]|nr:Nif11 family protein [Cyanobacteriota bacterium]
MSWSELQRLVEEAEADGAIRRGLRRCRSRRELLMASRRLGYGIQAQDLRRAWQLEQTEAGRVNPADPGNSFAFRQAAG